MDTNPLSPMAICYFYFIALLILLAGCNDSRTTPIEGPLFISPGIAYHPRGFLPGSESPSPSREQVIEDLRLLRKNGFRSLVTYSSSGIQGTIPEIARHEGIDGMMIMGIWDPFSQEEWSNALSQSRFVDGYCLGNEGLGLRYKPEELASKIRELKRITGRPVTTSEPIDSYLNGPYRDWLFTHSDWLFPLAHPFWATQLNPNQAVNWIVSRHDYLLAITGRIAILKEAGFPSAGCPEGCDEEVQLAFFKALKSTGLSFFYFEAFDQPWKRNDQKHREAEAHWGIYQVDGTPKKVVLWLTNRSFEP